MTRTTFYVDQTSGLVSKLEYTNYAENDSDAQQKVEIVFSDYRNINGAWVPFRQTSYTDGKLESELVLSSVSFNVGVPDSEFDLPAEVTNAQ